MDIDKIRKDLSIRGKSGLGFLLSGFIIWIIITVIFSLDMGLYEKNISMLIASGLMFPLSVGISTLIKADWKLEGNPLGQLGIFLNIAQIIYFPILFWAIGKSPEEAVMIFAIITGAHFFPYGWFYQAIPYTVMAPVTSLAIMFVGWNVDTHQLWLVPLSLVVLLFFLLTWLHFDFKKKVQTEDVG